MDGFRHKWRSVARNAYWNNDNVNWNENNPNNENDVLALLRKK